ncbi:hypothetical protein PILCRDRAFT_11355 [Piloderma croceum F 1598]|uniref:Uncharacterized protein n=1 Tax=Piloderma croceum (strain F 1598) TaxID=765440 RepID=A0A0C3AWJ6_PILCF|nr:hypothetical protein PILCRDRAFT_11355 [Piloderma croceum F 1598]
MPSTDHTQQAKATGTLVFTGALAVKLICRPNSIVLANTEALHEKIEHLRSRVRELEDGLRALHSQQCLISHILSLETICRVSKHPQPVPVLPDQIILHHKLNHLRMRGARTGDDDSLIDGFGTLTVESKGESNFLGRTARSEVEPSSSRRTVLYNTYLNGVYKADTNDCIYWPAVSLLFVIFALGALFDPARPPFSIESQEYYLLSRVSLINFVEPIFKTTSIVVLTLVHLTQYLELSDWEGTGSPSSGRIWDLRPNLVSVLDRTAVADCNRERIRRSATVVKAVVKKNIGLAFP